MEARPRRRRGRSRRTDQREGKSEAVAAYSLLDVDPVASGIARHLDAPIVGRERELEVLEDSIRRSAGDASAVLVTIVAPPGVGKSRLVDEFATRHRADAIALHGRCISYGDGITYWPVVEILTAAAGIAEEDGPDEVRAKLDTLVQGTKDAATVVDRLAGFLGLSSQSMAPEEIHWAVRRFFETLASDRPVIAVFEDVHWAEPALLDLVEHLVAWSTGAPVVVVCTARPELQEERPDWGAASSRATTLRLDPLGEDDVQHLVANLLGASDLPGEARAVVAAAEGNPLFVEQLVGMLAEDGHLIREGDRWRTTGDLGSIPIPATIAGILDARLDHLTASEADVLACGSVEGRAFHWASVTAMSSEPDPTSIGRDLLALTRRGLVEPTPSLISGTEAFRFRHALIRDAYRRLGQARRAARATRTLARTHGRRAPRRVRRLRRLPHRPSRAAPGRARPVGRERQGPRRRGGGDGLGGDPGDGARGLPSGRLVAPAGRRAIRPATRSRGCARAARGGAHGGG